MGEHKHDCRVCKRIGPICPCINVELPQEGDPVKIFDDWNAARLYKELAAASAELAEWRSGRRRIVWRVTWTSKHGSVYKNDHAHRSHARGMQRFYSCQEETVRATVRRVTVGPAKGAK